MSETVESQPTMRMPYRITAVLLLALAAFFAYHATRLPYYTPLGPGAGFFPVWLSVLLAVLSIAMFAQTFGRRVEAVPADFGVTGLGALRIIATLLFIAFFVVALIPLGFRVTTLIVGLGLIHIFGRANPLISVPAAAGMSLGIFYLFSDVLRLTLPTGPFGF
jgi:putative tricarboxylic transport membrane protein